MVKQGIIILFLLTLVSCASTSSRSQPKFLARVSLILIPLGEYKECLVKGGLEKQIADGKVAGKFDLQVAVVPEDGQQIKKFEVMLNEPKNSQTISNNCLTKLKAPTEEKLRKHVKQHAAEFSGVENKTYVGVGNLFPKSFDFYEKSKDSIKLKISDKQ